MSGSALSARTFPDAAGEGRASRHGRAVLVESGRGRVEVVAGQVSGRCPAGGDAVVEVCEGGDG